LDALLLHSPLPTVEETIQAWKVLETYVPGKIGKLGISNVSLPVLQAVYQAASVKPKVVQNRFYPQTKYDVQLRAFCREHGIEYQSFWTLTGNPHLVQTKPVMRLAEGAGVSVAVALYALVVDLGIVVLNGTTSGEHMREDVEGVEKVRKWAEGNESEWEEMRMAIRKLVGETESTVKELEDMWD
jgi:diketogulonate reductase-like aldo/keto reductase